MIQDLRNDRACGIQLGGSLRKPFRKYKIRIFTEYIFQRKQERQIQWRFGIKNLILGQFQIITDGIHHLWGYISGQFQTHRRQLFP